MADYDLVINAQLEGMMRSQLAATSAEIKNLVNQLDSINSASRNYRRSQQAVNTALGIGSDGTRVYAKTTMDAARNAAILENRLRLNVRQLKAVNDQLKGNAVSKYIQSTTGHLTKQNSHLKQSVTHLRSIEKAAGRIRFTRAIRDSESLARNILNVGKNLQYVGRNLTIGLTLPIVQFFRTGLESYKKLQNEVIRFNKIFGNDAINALKEADATIVRLEKTTEGWVRVSQGTGKAYDAFTYRLDDITYKFGVARELVQGLAADFATLGISDTGVIADLVEITAEVEKLGDVDIATSRAFVQSLFFQSLTVQRENVRKGTQAFVNYDLAIQQVQSSLYMFNLVENNTVVTMQMLTKAIPEMQAVTTQFGLSLLEASSMFAPMIAAGMEVGASGNSIKVSLQRLVAPAKQNREILQELANSVGGFNFEVGVGIDSVAELARSFNVLKETKGLQGALELFARLFGVRQGSRMLQAFTELAYFQEQLGNSASDAFRVANTIVDEVNKAVAESGVEDELRRALGGGVFSASDLATLSKISTVAGNEFAKGFDNGGTVLGDAIVRGQAVANEKLQQTLKDGASDYLDQIDSQAGKILLAQAAGTAKGADVYNQELLDALEAPAVKLARAREMFKSISRELIPPLVEALEAITPTIKKFAESFKNMSPAVKKLITGGLLIAAAFGPVITVFSNLTQLVGSLRLGFFKLINVLASSTIFGKGGRIISADTLAGINNLDKFGNKLSRISDEAFFFSGSNRKFQKQLRKSIRSGIQEGYADFDPDAILRGRRTTGRRTSYAGLGAADARNESGLRRLLGFNRLFKQQSTGQASPVAATSKAQAINQLGDRNIDALKASFKSINSFKRTMNKVSRRLYTLDEKLEQLTQPQSPLHFFRKNLNRNARGLGWLESAVDKAKQKAQDFKTVLTPLNQQLRRLLSAVKHSADRLKDFKTHFGGFKGPMAGLRANVIRVKDSFGDLNQDIKTVSRVLKAKALVISNVITANENNIKAKNGATAALIRKTDAVDSVADANKTNKTATIANTSAIVQNTKKVKAKPTVIAPTRQSKAGQKAFMSGIDDMLNALDYETPVAKVDDAIQQAGKKAKASVPKVKSTKLRVTGDLLAEIYEETVGEAMASEVKAALAQVDFESEKLTRESIAGRINEGLFKPVGQTKRGPAFKMYGDSKTLRSLRPGLKYAKGPLAGEIQDELMRGIYPSIVNTGIFDTTSQSKGDTGISGSVLAQNVARSESESKSVVKKISARDRQIKKQTADIMETLKGKKGRQLSPTLDYVLKKYNLEIKAAEAVRDGLLDSSGLPLPEREAEFIAAQERVQQLQKDRRDVRRARSGLKDFSRKRVFPEIETFAEAEAFKKSLLGQIETRLGDEAGFEASKLVYSGGLDQGFEGRYLKSLSEGDRGMPNLAASMERRLSGTTFGEIFEQELDIGGLRDDVDREIRNRIGSKGKSAKDINDEVEAILKQKRREIAEQLGNTPEDREKLSAFYDDPENRKVDGKGRAKSRSKFYQYLTEEEQKARRRDNAGARKKTDQIIEKYHAGIRDKLTKEQIAKEVGTKYDPRTGGVFEKGAPLTDLTGDAARDARIVKRQSDRVARIAKARDEAAAKAKSAVVEVGDGSGLQLEHVLDSVSNKIKGDAEQLNDLTEMYRNLEKSDFEEGSEERVSDLARKKKEYDEAFKRYENANQDPQIVSPRSRTQKIQNQIAKLGMTEREVKDKLYHHLTNLKDDTGAAVMKVERDRVDFINNILDGMETDEVEGVLRVKGKSLSAASGPSRGVDLKQSIFARIDDLTAHTVNQMDGVSEAMRDSLDRNMVSLIDTEIGKLDAEQAEIIDKKLPAAYEARQKIVDSGGYGTKEYNEANQLVQNLKNRGKDRDGKLSGITKAKQILLERKNQMAREIASLDDNFLDDLLIQMVSGEDLKGEFQEIQQIGKKKIVGGSRMKETPERLAKRSILDFLTDLKKSMGPEAFAQFVAETTGDVKAEAIEVAHHAKEVAESVADAIHPEAVLNEAEAAVEAVGEKAKADLVESAANAVESVDDLADELDDVLDFYDELDALALAVGFMGENVTAKQEVAIAQIILAAERAGDAVADVGDSVEDLSDVVKVSLNVVEDTVDAAQVSVAEDLGDISRHIVDIDDSVEDVSDAVSAGAKKIRLASIFSRKKIKANTTASAAALAASGGGGAGGAVGSVVSAAAGGGGGGGAGAIFGAMKGGFSMIGSFGFGIITKLLSIITGLISRFLSLVKVVSLLVTGATVFAPLIAGAVALAVAIKNLISAMSASESLRQRLTDGLKKLGEAAKRMVKPFIDAINAFFGFNTGAKEVNQSASMLGAILLTLIEKVTSFIDTLSNSTGFQKFSNSAVSSMTQVLNIVVTFGQAVMAAIGGDTELAGKKFDQVMMRLKYSAYGLVQQLIPIWKKMVEYFIFATIISAEKIASIMSDLLLVAIPTMLRGLAGAFKTFWGGVVKQAQLAWEAIKDQKWDVVLDVVAPAVAAAGVAVGVGMSTTGIGAVVGVPLAAAATYMLVDSFSDASENFEANEFGEIVSSAISEIFTSVDGKEFGTQLGADIYNGLNESLQSALDELDVDITEARETIATEFQNLYNMNIEDPVIRFSIEESADIYKLADEISQAYAQALDAGGEELADEVGGAVRDAVADALKSATQQFVDYVVDYMGKQLDKFKNALTSNLKDKASQKLQIFDDQIAAIDALEKAEQDLFKEQERIEDDRKRMRERALAEENYNRNRALAIYEGRVDDARMLDLERKVEVTNNAETDARITRDRLREEQAKQRDIVKDIIKKQKEDLKQRFDDLINDFEEFAATIGDQGTLTQEELQAQFDALIQQAGIASDDMLSAFEDYYTAIPGLIDQYTDPTIGFFEAPLNELVNSAKAIFGLTSGSEDSDTILGVTASMLSGIGNMFTDESGIFQSLPETAADLFEAIKDESLIPAMSAMETVIAEFDVAKIMEDAYADANERILRQYQVMIDSSVSLTAAIAANFDPVIEKLVATEAAAKAAADAIANASGSGGGGGGGSGYTPPALTKGTIDSVYGMKAIYDNTSSIISSSFSKIAIERMAPGAVDTFRKAVMDFELYRAGGNSNQASYNEVKAGVSGDALKILKSYVKKFYPSVSLFKGGMVKKYGMGGMASYGPGGIATPGFANTAIPALLHGGEFVLNNRAVQNIGMSAKLLETLNKSTFSVPKTNFNSGVTNNYNTTATTNIYVDNFIGEDEWFRSMLKEYNIKHKQIDDRRYNIGSPVYTTYKGASFN